MEELSSVCFREKWYDFEKKTGVCHQVREYVSYWKDLTDNQVETIMDYKFGQCSWTYRVDFVVVKNETIYVYEWDDFKHLNEYVMDWLPNWCRELVW